MSKFHVIEKLSAHIFATTNSFESADNIKDETSKDHPSLDFMVVEDDTEGYSQEGYYCIVEGIYITDDNKYRALQFLSQAKSAIAAVRKVKKDHPELRAPYKTYRIGAVKEILLLDVFKD